MAEQALNGLQFSLSRSLSCDEPENVFPRVIASVDGWFRRGQCLAWLEREGWKLDEIPVLISADGRYVGHCVVYEYDTEQQVKLSFYEAANVPSATGP